MKKSNVVAQNFKIVKCADVAIGSTPERFTGVEVHGMREIGDAGDIDSKTQIIDDENPEFFSTYLRHVKGEAICVGDFPSQPQAIAYAKELAVRYNWDASHLELDEDEVDPVMDSMDSKNTLSRLFHNLRHQLDITTLRWIGLVEQYVNDPLRGTLTDVEKSSLQANLLIELSRPDMTWKVFCKGLDVLQIGVASINLVVTGKEGVTGEVATIFHPKQ
jgi:hypothetical protein